MLALDAGHRRHWLVSQGIGSEDRVAVLIDKSPDLVITALGVLKAGAVYLPVDPTYPDDRLAFVLADSNPKLVLREPITGLPQYSSANPATEELARPLRPDNTAYLIYTFGSTGLPKGVPVPHAPVAEYFRWFGDKYQVDETDRLLQVASPSCDVSIAGLFAGLLGHARVGADDSFFGLGGHSLVASKLVAAIRSECGVEVGIRDVFELATVARLAERIDQWRSGGVPALRRPKLIRTSHDGPLPLSASQLRAWFAYRIEGPSEANNIPFPAWLRGPCDIKALIAAIGDVVARHEILRTTYAEIDGVPYQVVHAVSELPVRRAVHGGGADEAWVQAQLDDERRHRFELDRDWPIRAAVLQTGDQHVLSLVIHHIASDHWSGEALFGDLPTAYRARRAGQTPSWAQLPVQYAATRPGRVHCWRKTAGLKRGKRPASPERSATTGGSSWTGWPRTPAYGRTFRDSRYPAAPVTPPNSPSTHEPVPSSPSSAASWASPSSCCCKRPSRWCCTKPLAPWTFRWAPRPPVAPNPSWTK
jgi:acyl carrier protein